MELVCLVVTRKTSALIFLLLLTAVFPPTPSARDQAAILKWSEGQLGCTFSADDDGKYRYGLWTGSFGITLAVDAQELQKSVRRIEPLFALWLTLHYRGSTSIALRPEVISLEFVKHEHDVERSLDPEKIATELQAEADAFRLATTREISKHPEQKAEREVALQSHLQDVEQTELFVKSRGLPAATLDPAHAETSGWVFFKARSKWVGDWRPQEEFMLRVPLGQQVVEFPFALPPSEGDLLLRKRPGL